MQNLSTKLEKCEKNMIFSDFWDLYPRLTVLDQQYYPVMPNQDHFLKAYDLPYKFRNY